MIRRLFKEWLLNVLAWVAITNFYSLAILTNMKVIVEMAKIEDIIAANKLASYFTSSYQFFESTLFGIIFGTLFYFINQLIDKISARKMPFGKIIILKTFMYLIAMVVVFFTMGIIFELLYFYPVKMSDFLSNKEIVKDPTFYISFFTFILFTAILVNFLVQVSYKIGPKLVLPMFLGKYHTPKSENRIFLFLDLKNSTGIAEDLGHMKYSKLLQDCYYDLNKIVFKLNAEIYQYVGDEVVLTWENKKNFLSKYAIRTTFKFRSLLEKRSAYYLKNYGFIPEFKGGLNLGKVSVAEIGEIKRDIAYHGDVVNTAARLQEAAKEYGKILMASEKVINELTSYDGFAIEEMPTIELKGKRRKVNVFCVEETSRVRQEELPVS